MPTKLQSYLALAVILIGVVCLAIGEVELSNANQVDVGTRYLVWSSADNLTDGHTYRVYISGDNWGDAFSTSGFTSEQPLNVTITSPGGGVTRLQAFYWGEPASGLVRGGTPPTIVRVTWGPPVDDSGLSADVSSSQIVFTARQSGLYNVSVPPTGGLFYTSKQPPDHITFYEYVTPNGEAYSLLAAGGGGLIVLGGVSFVVTRFRARGVKRRRTAK